MKLCLVQATWTCSLISKAGEARLMGSGQSSNFQLVWKYVSLARYRSDFGGDTSRVKNFDPRFLLPWILVV